MDTEGFPFDSKPPVVYICEECGKPLLTKTALVSHKKWKHETSNTELSCSSCKMVFARKFNLTRHVQGCRGPQSSTRIHTTIAIRCSLCNLYAISRVRIHDHYQKDHKIDLSEHQLTFDSIEDFYIWKDQFESDTKSNFVKTSGTRQGKNNTQINKYVCHRDGNFQSKGKNIRKMKNRKSNKIGSYCPARIHVYASNENVTVKYIGTHFGHENEIDRLYIPKSEKKRLAQKIALKIPFAEILNEIHDSVQDEPHRLHLLNRKDLWNIATSYNLNHKAILHQKDYSNVVAKLSSSKLLRFYMAQGEQFEIFNEVTTKCEDASLEEKKTYILDVQGDQYEICNEVTIKHEDASLEEKKTYILDIQGEQFEICNEVTTKHKDASLEEKKTYILDALLKSFKSIKTEEQLQAVRAQIAPLDDIVKSISENNNMLVPVTSNT